MTPLVATVDKADVGLREAEAETRPAVFDTDPALDSTALRAFLEQRLSEHVARPEVAGRLVRVVVPAPRVEPERLLDVAPRCAVEHGHGVLWDPAEGAMGPRIAGVGAAARLDIDEAGPERFDALQSAAGALFDRLDEIVHPEAPKVSARVYGGLAFDDRAGSTDGDILDTADEPWAEFGGGCFTLPRLLYVLDGDRAGLALTVPVAAVTDAADRELAIDGMSAVLAGLADEPTTEWPSGLSAVAETTPDAADWIRRVEAIRAAIAAGDVEKIVAARRSTVRLGRAPSVPEVLRRLKRGLMASTRFAFCRQRAAFLGATPERLIAKSGRRFETEALAGSIESGSEHVAELLDSGKDRLEQQLVVDAIVRRLEPLCDALRVADRPSVRELKDVMHLHTAIRGELAGERHVLELVAMLHPTPAVGGVPTAAAVDWIRHSETHSRGWYAAPVGWFDADGDGELMVALRSCVLAGDRAWLWAGAGIVGDSDPEAELAETALKEQALLGALGG